MKKILMVATTAAMIEQFNKNNIMILEEMGYEVHVVGNWLEGNPISDERLEEFKNWLDNHHAQWFQIPSTRKPLDVKNNSAAYRSIVELINKNKYEFMHCHTPIGSVIGRCAAHKTQTKVIYTAHGFHFFKGAPLKNWLLYYPVEKFLSRWTDVLITINNEDYERAKKKFHMKKLVKIPGVGIDTRFFETLSVDKVAMRKELGIPKEGFVLLSVGELQKHKNHIVVINALGKIQNKNIYYLIAGKGILSSMYKKKIEEYHLEGNIRLLGYRKDIADLCKAADCFVHPSIREGLGIAPLEGMASGLPLINSYIGGMRDYTDNGISGCCINPYSVDAMMKAINKVYKDKEFCKQCGKNNIEEVKKYDFRITNKIMKAIYMTVENK